ncbi:MAG: NAD-glutamate dehydrogenase [Alphaproteobacteria bacterium]|nr:NAD-glutamate dehydrogenase [Alphaproteobacteria bacterium]
MSTEKKTLSAFAKAFYQRVPVEDMEGWSAKDLQRVVASMFASAETRKPGKQNVRVFTPEQKRDGWHAPHSVIQLVNDDMPFIIDSVTAELAAQNLTVEVLFHPILQASRGKGGRLKDIQAEKGRGYVTESYVYIQLEQMLSPEAADRLAARLGEVLDDVRAATGDWKNLMVRMDDVVRSLEATSNDPARADDLSEAYDFLKYLQNGNFTFLGYRAFRFSGANGKTQSVAVAGTDLGVMKKNALEGFGRGAGAPEAAAMRSAKSPVMISKLIGQYSNVHRRAPLDAVGVRIYDKKGRLSGMHLFVGLFTSGTYSCRTGEVPIVRLKVREIIKKSGFHSGTHDRAALEHILETMPRDELFQAPADELYDTAIGLLRLRAKHRVALFTHADPMQQYMSCLVYVPRDRYNTRFRAQAEAILEEAVGGKSTNYFTNLDDSPLARILFTIRFDEGPRRRFDQAETERKLIELGREWDERLRQVLIITHGKTQGAALADVYGRAFSSAYHESVEITNAIHDIRRLEDLLHGDDKICVDFYRLQGEPGSTARLKVYHKDSPVSLSEILPVLENMGLKGLSEMPYEVHPRGRGGETVWIHDFALLGAEKIRMDLVKNNFEETFLQVWKGRAENDALNRLVLSANLTWREIIILRAYNRFMRQQKFPFSVAYIEQVLGMYPKIARELVNLYLEMHDPKVRMPPEKRGRKTAAHILDMLQEVQKLDHDRILRGFKTLVENTLRTNYFQTHADGTPKSVLAVKLNSRMIPDLPLPRPHVEIFVYSTRVEAVHLRGGEIARGGIRWSDRHDDFRTEILGLMKSQMVKNAVIVPVGAKGGFVVKQPPKTGGRAAYQEEGIACYKIFIKALLDLTDNNVGGKIVRPKDVVCHDGIDPYLVVAADKGTATFSNIANALSAEAGFWLGDAFASGGSAGYDHKAIAITARGGWESVMRHFHEMGKDTQTQPFTLVGVGDMAGDVFGNGMLLSKKMRLLGAFNHIHIFCDPDPDMAVSYAERARLFKTRGGWDMYDKKKLSAGGMVYERSAKTLKLTPQIKKCFGIEEDHVTPDELILAILKAEAELIWFGGIGTYIKSSKQSHADVDDKSNDAIRVDATEVRARVIGEGANLGVTQLARVEYARLGGRINTDFIDNSGGVDCSDHEVNIKILLADVMAKRRMTLPQRNKLLQKMTKEVAALVLRDNYQQTQSLSLLQFRAKENLGMHAEFIRDLEKAGLIRRALEGLPDEETLVRLQREGRGLTRPELSILLAYAKMTLFTELMKTDLPDDPALEGMLFDYFPKELHKYGKEIRNHKLKRGIIATQVVNVLVNRMGPTFVQSRILKVGASGEEVIRAFMIVMESFRVNEILASVEALDGKAPYQAQMTAFHEVSQMVKRAVTWFLRFGGGHLQVTAGIASYKPGVEMLRRDIRRVIPQGINEGLARAEAKFIDKGLPVDIAEEIAVLNLLSSANDIITIAHRAKGDIRAVAAAYFETGELLGLDWLRRQAALIEPQSSWQARVVSGLTDDFFSQQAALTSAILHAGGKKKSSGTAAQMQKKRIDAWFDGHQDVVGKIVQMVSDLKREKDVELEMLTLVSQRIGQLVHQARG